MPTIVTTRVLGREDVEAALRPWNGLFREKAEGEGRFAIETGAVTRYQRTVTVESIEPADLDGDGGLGGGGDHGDGDERSMVTQTIDYRLTLPFFLLLYLVPVHRQLKRLPLHQGPPPWWAPPEAIDATAARALCGLAILSLVAGYLGTLITQTMAFAGAEFGVGTGGQSTALAFSRVDIVIAIAVAALADRRGRRRVVLASILGALGLTALAAAAPSLPLLIAIQVPARGLTAGAVIVIAILATEVVPSRCRAYALSVLFLIGAFGAGQCVMSLPLADLSVRGWRLSYVLPLAYLPLVLGTFRLLPESRRFRSRNTSARLVGHGRRLALLIVSGFLIQVFASPASQLQNTFLRDERGYSAGRIALFTLLTSTPGGLGVVIGGRMADLRGRRIVGAVAVLGGTGFAVFQYLTRGWSLWSFSALSAITASAGVPALSVYGPELFPTAVRGKANGLISAAQRFGAVVGLLGAGLLTDALGHLGPALAVLALAPAAVAVLILVAYPETAGIELEALNPEDTSP